MTTKPDPYTPKWTTKIATAKKVKGVTYTEMENAIDRWNNWTSWKKYIKTETDKFYKRLAKTKVASYYIDSGKIYFQFEITQPTGYKTFPKTSLNENHWFQNMGHGLDGIHGNDFTRIDTYNYKMSISHSDLEIQSGDAVKNAFVLSHDKSLPARKAWGIDTWRKAFKSTKDGMGETIADWIANAGSVFGVSVPYPPTSDGYDMNAWFGNTGQDDVDWWRSLTKYSAIVDKALIKIVNDVNTQVARVKAQEKAANGGKDTGNFADTPKPKTGGGKGGKGGKGDKPGGGDNGSVVTNDGKLVYNMPGVKEMYFSSGGLSIADDVKFVTPSNQPIKITDVDKLWINAGGHKGMIKNYVIIGNLVKNPTWFQPLSGKDKVNGAMANKHSYAFQFLYNPSTVTMNYSGAPQVDPGKMASGQDAVPLMASSTTSSTISFSLLLNRMQDMKYANAIINDSTNSIAKEVYPWIPDGTLIYDTEKPGGKKITAQNEVRRIKELGTMYDIEFFLQTLIGYKVPSTLRTGEAKFTADIGYLGAYPVELHLGKNLRYLGTIDAISISHTIFTADMVPVFSNLSLTFNRLPEFQDTNKFKTGKK